jgi:hypothetical protein
MISSRRSGTSLVEILVVIVVFLVGILAIVQIFPGGFRLLATTQKNTIATWLGRNMIETLKNHADQMPQAILPVRYIWTGSQFLIQADPDRFPGDLGPAYNNLSANGTFFDGNGNAVGGWQYLIGANIGRRVIGEGKSIPSPRMVGSQYGSLLSLQFAPVVFNPAYASIFVVYGNDMLKRFGDPNSENYRVRDGEFFVDEDDTSQAAIYVPPATPPAVGTRKYRIELTVYTDDPAELRKDIVDYVTDPIAAGASWAKISVASIVPTVNVTGIEYDSVRVQRVFDDVTSSGFTSDPYEFKLLSPQLGLVLFNPAGYNYMIRTRGGRREPLTGRVSYDVYDWRIIHDEFRTPEIYPAQYRLAVGSLKVTGEAGPDGNGSQGIGVSVPDSTGAFNPADLVLQDVDTGGLYMFAEGTRDPNLTSFTVNKSIGLITFLDHDNDRSNGTQLMLLLPGNVTPIEVPVDGRSLRALYMGKNEWAVQVLKPAARYVQTWGRPGIGEYYLGDSSAYGLNPARIYFPPADAGRVVSIGELYYTNSFGAQVGPLQLTAKLQTNNMDNPQRLPYIDVQSYFPDFAAFDYSYGTAVKSVKGASVAVRVLWNPDYFTLGPDAPTNMDHLDKWMQGWRRQTVETYLQRGN